LGEKKYENGWRVRKKEKIARNTTQSAVLIPKLVPRSLPDIAMVALISEEKGVSECREGPRAAAREIFPRSGGGEAVTRHPSQPAPKSPQRVRAAAALPHHSRSRPTL
jgi:hypothetical protein